jgi:hypothetical protein
MRRVLMFVAASLLAVVGIAAVQPACAGAVCLGSGDNRPVYILQDGTARASFTTTGLLQLLVGASATGRVNATLTTSTTSTCTIADTNETDLWSYTLPANTLNADGRGLQVVAWGTTGATANNKTVKGYVAGTSQITTGAQATNDGSWKISWNLLRTGSTTVTVDSESRIGVNASSNATIKADTRSMTADSTAAIILKVTGTNGTAAANDICAKGAAVTSLY